ncbi:MAG: hypothetical protein ABSG43_02695 [Solirubrobacteraceae bacterium]
MNTAKSIRGKARQGDAPDWSPLENLLDTELCAQFMWMFDVKLEDGTLLNAYKHIWTRRYFHLSDDGRTFYYAGERGYHEVDPYTAIVEVFETWECADPTDSERLALETALRVARGHPL